MNTRWFGLALTLAGSLTLARPAWADLPPPDGYVETCTIANQQTAVSECVFCKAYYAERNRCGGLLVPYCFSWVCNTWGASVWTELWCRTKGVGVPLVPAETLNALNPSSVTLQPAPDGGPVTAPSSCLPYTPGGAGGQGGASAAGGSGSAAAGGAGGTSGSDAGKPNDSSGCAVAGWLSAKALGPWILAGLFGAAVMLARRRRR
jgi:hypothetical protein